MTKQINPRYEFIVDHSLASGDRCCHFRVVKTNEFQSDSETLALVVRPRLGSKVKRYYAYAQLGELWTIYSNALVEHAGREKAIEIMKPYMLQSGMSFGLSIQQRYNITGNDATTIGSIISLSNEAIQQYGRQIILNPERFEKEIIECPFSNSSHQICADLLTMRSKGIASAINPDYEYTLTSRMCKGDKVCHWVVNKK
jgi:hypothetical protein